MGRHSGRRRAPRRAPVGVTLAPLLTLAVGAVVVLPGPVGAGVGGAPRAYAARVDPTPSRPVTPPGRLKPRPTTTLTGTPTDLPTTSEPTDPTRSHSPLASPASLASLAPSGSGGGRWRSFQSRPSHTTPPQPTGRVTPGGGGGGNQGNGNGNGGGKPTQVAVAGRKVASPARDGRSSVDAVPAARSTMAPVPQETGSPEDTSSVTSEAPAPSATSTTASTGPDLADPPADDAMPGTWGIAALAALLVLGLAVALLIASARPRGGAHRRH